MKGQFGYRDMTIDSHTHIYPDAIASAVVQKLSAPTGLVPPTDGTAAGLKNEMRRAGVDRAIVLPVATNPVKVDHLNDFAFKLNGSGGLYSFGAIHPDFPAWKEELRRIRAHGLKGIKVHPIYQGVDFDDIRFLRIFEYAAELGLYVVTHAGYDIGYPGSERSTPQKIRQAIREVGDFPLILAHMGGWMDWENAAALLADTHVLLDTAFSLGTYSYRNDDARIKAIADCFGTVGDFLKAEPFLRFVRAFGADRILFGSDSPWDSPETGVRFVQSLPLSQAEKELILGGNAQRLFFSEASDQTSSS